MITPEKEPSWIRKNILKIVGVLSFVSLILLLRFCYVAGQLKAELDTNPKILTKKEAQQVISIANSTLQQAKQVRAKADTTLRSAATKEYHIVQQLAVIDSLTQLHDEIPLDSTAPVASIQHFLANYKPSAE